jgi:tetrahydromethanopterin S-methyltransferase subunit B
MTRKHDTLLIALAQAVRERVDLEERVEQLNEIVDEMNKMLTPRLKPLKRTWLQRLFGY